MSKATDNFEIGKGFTLPAGRLSVVEGKLDALARQRAKEFARAEALLVEVLREVEQTRLYEKLLLPNTYTYCVRVLNLSEDVASNFSRVAQKSLEVPSILEALSEGELTVSKARQILSVLTPKNKDEWLEKARTLSKAALEMEVARVNPKAAKREKIRAIAEGRYQLEVGASEALVQKLRRAQEVCCQLSGESSDFERTLEIALEYFLKMKDPVVRAERARARTTHPKPVPVARGQRRPIPAHVRHEVHKRDRGRCQAALPNGGHCGASRWTDLHHIVAVADDGKDVPENLVTLCSFHHRFYHQENSGKDAVPGRISRKGET